MMTTPGYDLQALIIQADPSFVPLTACFISELLAYIYNATLQGDQQDAVLSVDPRSSLDPLTWTKQSVDGSIMSL